MLSARTVTCAEYVPRAITIIVIIIYSVHGNISKTLPPIFPTGKEFGYWLSKSEKTTWKKVLWSFACIKRYKKMKNTGLPTSQLIEHYSHRGALRVPLPNCPPAPFQGPGHLTSHVLPFRVLEFFSTCTSLSFKTSKWCLVIQVSNARIKKVYNLEKWFCFCVCFLCQLPFSMA